MTNLIRERLSNLDKQLMLMLQASRKLRCGLSALVQLRNEIVAAERPVTDPARPRSADPGLADLGLTDLQLADLGFAGVGAGLVENMPVPGLPAHI